MAGWILVLCGGRAERLTDWAEVRGATALTRHVATSRQSRLPRETETLLSPTINVLLTRSLVFYRRQLNKIKIRGSFNANICRSQRTAESLSPVQAGAEITYDSSQAFLIPETILFSCSNNLIYWYYTYSILISDDEISDKPVWHQSCCNNDTRIVMAETARPPTSE